MSAPQNFDPNVPTSNPFPFSPSPQPGNIQQAVSSTILLQNPVANANQYIMVVQNLIAMDCILNTFLLMPYLGMTGSLLLSVLISRFDYLVSLAFIIVAIYFSLIVCALYFGSFVWQATRPGMPNINKVKSWIYITSVLMIIDFLWWFCLAIFFISYYHQLDIDVEGLIIALKICFIMCIPLAMRMVAVYFVNAFHQEGTVIPGGMLGTVNAGMPNTPSTMQMNNDPLPKGNQDSDSAQ